MTSFKNRKRKWKQVIFHKYTVIDIEQQTFDAEYIKKNFFDGLASDD